MEKKNMVLLTVIAVATLLVAVIGATFAFFTATVQDDRDDSGDTGATSLTAGSVASTTVVGSVSGAAGQFTATDVYPGHMEVAALSVKADNKEGDKNSVTDIAIKYNVTKNDFADNEIKVSVYKKEGEAITGISKAEDSTGNNNYFQCTHQSKDAEQETDFSGVEEVPAGTKIFYEECANKDGLTDGGATLVGTAQLVKQTPDEYLFETSISADAHSETTVNYYFVLEFVNTKQATSIEAQNGSMNDVIQGNITVVPA